MNVRVDPTDGIRGFGCARDATVYYKITIIYICSKSDCAEVHLPTCYWLLQVVWSLTISTVATALYLSLVTKSQMRVSFSCPPLSLSSYGAATAMTHIPI